MAKLPHAQGSSQWITGELARQEGHRLRHAADAILVGIGTVLQDDPQLTTRLPDGQGVNPLRVIVDSTLRVPLQAQVTDVASNRRTLIVTTARAPVAHREACVHGALRLSASRRMMMGGWTLRRCSAILASVVLPVFWSKGGNLSATLLRRRLVDKVLLFVAPKIIGGDGISVVGPCGVETMEQVINLRDVVSQRLGNDVLLEAYCTTEVVSS